MTGYNLPPGCRRLPGDEPDEPLYHRLAEGVARELKKRHGEWRERGNREDYIACDCGKDADLDNISTGIMSVSGTDTGLTVEWGWLATFCAVEDCAEIAQEMAIGCAIPGTWECDCESDPSWTVSGHATFHVDMDGVVNDACPDGLASVGRAAKAVWGRFLLERRPLEEEARLLHDALDREADQ